MQLSIDDRWFREKTIALSALYQVVDPELCVNIIDLGLVYGLDFDDASAVTVTMTLSTPHCPMGESIITGVKNALSGVFPEKIAEVQLVWDPAWNYTMMTEEGRAQLNL
ncbi:metal-sulfur cluster assembly factor [Puia dinghuensis]|uniref:MIP18 family-like domain-containing protein n=1 Tax=Puia dinghuensis TaxID=1792502 RepID=A0A8J2UDP2_9BACT|nr:metal-sulfur cluster assembly factor [Puia dinghuensis]GGB03358.1 hypothetical protein GCM10011511_28300 [Puia dinghuensis]